MITSFQIIEKGKLKIVYTETDGRLKHNYTQRLELLNEELIKWSCDCVWGSVYRFKFLDSDKYPCRHIKEIIEFLKFNKYIKN